MKVVWTTMVIGSLAWIMACAQEPAPAPAIHVTFDDDEPGLYQDAAAKADWPGLKWFGLKDRGRIVAAEGDAGQRFLELTYPKDKLGPGDNGGQFLVQLPPRDEYWLDYFVMFRPGFDFRKGGKLPGLCGGGSKSTGGNNHPGEAWSARYMWKKEGGVMVYLYHMDQPGKYGDGLTLPNCKFEPGRWHRLTQHLQVNTDADRNGVLQVWFDRKLVLDRHDLRLRSEGRAPVDTFYFSTFHGGNTQDWAPLNDSYACYDNFLIAGDEATALDPERRAPE